MMAAITGKRELRSIRGGRAIRLTLTAAFGLMLLLGLAGSALAQSSRPAALTIAVDGVINPVKERYVARALQQAAARDAPLVIIQLDTPGGLGSSTREIVTLLLAAERPVVVYVTPQGAQAGSAGAFITAAAHIAVMAPGTNIGAATPVGAGGEDLGETLADKVTNDAAALMRSIAAERGRNADKLEATVRQAASYTATEAVELNIADFIAADLDDLLAQLDGREVTVSGRPWTLDTAGLTVQNLDKNLLEYFLEFIANPDIAFLLLTIGGLGIAIELFNPGMIVPGVVGGILLILAFVALGNLPANWAGVALIILAIALAIIETQVVGFGILGVGSIISLVLGGFLLFARFGDPSPTLPALGVNPWLIGGVAVVAGASLFFILWQIRQSRQETRNSHRPHLVGQVGTVIMELAPRGVVRLEDGNWTAVTDDDTVIPAGDRVVVIEADDLVLTVIPLRETE